MITSFVQLSDTHIREPGKLAYNRLNTAPYLATAVASVNTLMQKPDAVIITGDLTDFGRQAEYEHLRALLSPLSVPVYLLAGNHDSRTAMRQAFPDHTYLHDGQFLQYAVEIGPVRLLALDTVVPGHSHGALCAQRLGWLEQELIKAGEQPVVIAMHHPPFRTLIGHMDDIGLQEGAAQLESIVSRHKNVQRIICGHIHRAIDTRFGNTTASTCPSPAHQITLNLSPDAASDWMLEPPGFQVHAWDAQDQRLLSYTVPSGKFEGPHPFHENGELID